MKNYITLALGIIILGASVYVLTEWIIGIYGLAWYTFIVGWMFVDRSMTSLEKNKYV